MRVLSIDFDFFLNTDIYTREHKFPDGYETEGEKRELSREWEEYYAEYPEILKIDVIELEYSMIKDFLSGYSGPVYESESHAGIGRLFDLFDDDTELTNIDFHHDAYISGGSRLDCANWVRILKERYPGSSVKWVKREDSAVASLMGDFPYEMSDKPDLSVEYDLVFLCFSPEWTPPHLRSRYEELKSCAADLKAFNS